MKIFRNNIDKLPLILFYLGLTIELLLVVIDKSAIPLQPEGHIYRLTFVLFALKICFTKYTKREWLVLFIFTLFTFGMYLYTGNNLAFRAVALIAAMRGISLKPMMRFAFYLTLTGTIIIALLSFFNIGRGIKTTEVFRGELMETRYSFGMGHPNSFHFMVLFIIALLLYVYFDILNRTTLCLLLLGHFGLYLLTDSKAGFAVGTLMILGAILFKINSKLRQSSWIYYAGVLIFLFCIIISVWAAAVAIDSWSNPTISKIDSLFSGRIKNLYWDNHIHAGALESWSLFADRGNYIYEYHFDMGWVRMFYWFGIIPGLVFCIMFLLLLNECRKQKNYMGLLLTTAFSLYTVVEPQMMYYMLGRNYLLFLFGAYWGQMLYLCRNEEFYWWNAIGVSR